MYNMKLIRWLKKQQIKWKLVTLECDAMYFRVPVEQYIYERQQLLSELEELNYVA